MAEAVFQLGQKALIINERDEVLMVACRSTRDPKIIWHDFPGGRVDEGEQDDLNKALQRELKEELGIKAEVHELLTTVIAPDHGHKHRVILMVHHCSIASGELKPDNEILNFAWVPIDKVAAMPYSRYTVETIDKIKVKLGIKP